MPRCRRCKRVIKDPESIRIGLGKVCATREGISPPKSPRKARKGSRGYSGRLLPPPNPDQVVHGQMVLPFPPEQLVLVHHDPGVADK